MFENFNDGELPPLSDANSSRNVVDQFYQSANQWDTKNFNYEEYDPKQDIINLEQLQNNNSNNNKGAEGPRFVQENQEDDNQLALEVVGDDRQQLSMDILKKIGDKIN